MVTGAVMVLIEGQKGKIPKDRYLIFWYYLQIVLQVLGKGKGDDGQGGPIP